MERERERERCVGRIEWLDANNENRILEIIEIGWWGDGVNIFRHFNIFNIKSLDSRIIDIIFAARYESNNGNKEKEVKYTGDCV